MFLSSPAPGALGYISSSLEPRAYAGLAQPILCRAATQSELLTHTQSYPSPLGPFRCSSCTRSPSSQLCSLRSTKGPTGFAGPSPRPSPSHTGLHSLSRRLQEVCPSGPSCMLFRCWNALPCSFKARFGSHPSPCMKALPVMFPPRPLCFHFRAAGTAVVSYSSAHLYV